MTSEQDGIPAFLRVTPEEAERRKRFWEANPPTASTFSGQDDEAMVRQREARELEKKDRLAALAEATKVKRAKERDDAAAEKHGVYSTNIPGTIWNPTISKFVPRNYISPKKAARLRAELPTDAHRAAFDKLYGAGPVDSVAETSATTRGKAVDLESPEPRSASESAGRDRNPDAPPDGRRPGNRGPGLEAAAVSGATPAAKVAAMLSRPEGASLNELAAAGAGGKQPHSCSAFLTTAFRKKGAVISKTRDDARGGWVYHLDKEPAP